MLVCHDSYLTWVLLQQAHEDSQPNGTGENNSEEDMEDKEDTLPAHKCELGDTQEADYKTLKMLLNLNVQCTFQISLAPSSHCVSLTDLETCYSAPSFLTDLTSFLDSHLPTDT